MRADDTAFWAFTMLPEGPLVSRVPTPLQSIDSWSSVAVLEFRSPPAGDGRERRAVRPAHAASTSTRACGAVAGARASGAQEGEEDPVTGVPGVPTARAAGAILPCDFRVLVVALQPMREATHTVEAPARAAGMTGGEAVATPAAAIAPAEPPRKRKRGFSTLR
jgi:hypothetical protein